MRGTREPSPRPSVPWPGQVVAAALRPSARPADLGLCFPSLRLADAAFPFHGLKANPPPAKMVPLARYATCFAAVARIRAAASPRNTVCHPLGAAHKAAESVAAEPQSTELRPQRCGVPASHSSGPSPHPRSCRFIEGSSGSEVEAVADGSGSLARGRAGGWIPAAPPGQAEASSVTQPVLIRGFHLG